MAFITNQSPVVPRSRSLRSSSASSTNALAPPDTLPLPRSPLSLPFTDFHRLVLVSYRVDGRSLTVRPILSVTFVSVYRSSSLPVRRTKRRATGHETRGGIRHGKGELPEGKVLDRTL